MRALALLALLGTGCTHLVWYGRSDDRRHVASVIEQGGRQHVRVDMVDGPEVLGIGVDALAFGEEGEVAYPAQVADGWVVIHRARATLDRAGQLSPRSSRAESRDESGPRFDAIGELQLQHGQLLYTAEQAGKWHLVRDGKSSEGFDTILPGSLTVSSTGRVAFAAQDGRNFFAVIDGQRSAPMDAIGQLRFSTDGTRAGFIARRAGSSFIVIEGTEQGPFEAIAELQLGPPDVFIARTEGGWRVFVNGQPGESFERIAGLHTLGGVAYAARRGKQEWIIDGARQLGPFTSLKSQLARDTSGRLVFVAQREEAWLVSIGGEESGPWSEVETPALGGAHVGFIGERDRARVLVLDGKELAAWDWAGSLVLSPDGTRYAHLARRGAHTLLVVDGVERSFDVIVAGSLAFSKDSRRFACVTGEQQTRQLFITRDDGKRTAVDLEELVAALSRSSPEVALTSPDVTLLRRWVEAELEH